MTFSLEEAQAIAIPEAIRLIEEQRAASRDGCTCPPHVRCAHLDGVGIVWLIDWESPVRSKEAAACPRGRGYTRYAASTGSHLTTCTTCGKHLNLVITAALAYHDDLPAAEAAFAEREEQLLQEMPA